MNPTLLLWPAVIHAIVTLLLYIPMSRSRVASVKRGEVKASVFKLNIEEPEESLRFSNAIRNQNEIGVVFYAAVLTAYVVDAASFLTAAVAWIFVIAKCAHVWIHVTSNRLRFRRPVFSVAYLAVGLLWIAVAARLAGIL